MNFEWYTICVQAKTEDLVSRKIETVLGKTLGEEYPSYVEEIFVPKSTSTVIKDGQKKEVQNVAYPGYIFIKLNISDFLKMMLLGVDGVRSFLIGSDREPKKMSQKDYDDIISSVEKISNNVKAGKFFIVGDKVKIKEGSFQEFEGIVREINMDAKSLDVKVHVFGREIDVTIGFSGVEKLQ